MYCVGGKVIIPYRNVVIPDRNFVIPDRNFVIPDCKVIIPDCKVIIPDRNVVIPDLIGNPGDAAVFWIPVFTGMTGRDDFWIPVFTGMTGRDDFWIPVSTGMTGRDDFWIPVSTGMTEGGVRDDILVVFGHIIVGGDYSPPLCQLSFILQRFDTGFEGF